MHGRVALSVAGAALAAVTATALAQEPAGLDGNYGGGAVVSPPEPLGGAGNMLVGFRITGSTQLRLNAGLGARCESGYFSDTATLAADGSFSVAGSRTERLGGGRRLRTSYEVAGTVAGGAASGTARVRNRITQRGRATRTCTSGTVNWGARRATGAIGLAGATAKARIYGTTSQRLGGPRRAVVLRVSSDATKLTRAIYDVTLKCGSTTLTEIYDAPKRNLAIAAGGTVRDVERFTYRTRTTITRDTERFAATIGQTGASGTFSIVSRQTSRRTGRTISTCRSGTVRFTAAT